MIWEEISFFNLFFLTAFKIDVLCESERCRYWGKPRLIVKIILIGYPKIFSRTYYTINTKINFPSGKLVVFYIYFTFCTEGFRIQKGFAKIDVLIFLMEFCRVLTRMNGPHMSAGILSGYPFYIMDGVYG